jgi:uncharacterized membrane protein YphA (DoxX/SURF4 family)
MEITISSYFHFIIGLRAHIVRRSAMSSNSNNHVTLNSDARCNLVLVLLWTSLTISVFIGLYAPFGRIILVVIFLVATIVGLVESLSTLTDPDDSRYVKGSAFCGLALTVALAGLVAPFLIHFSLWNAFWLMALAANPLALRWVHRL